MALHKLLREDLRRLQSCGALCWAKDAQPLTLKPIHQACRKGVIGTHDGQTDSFLLGELQQSVVICDLDRHTGSDLSDACIARGAIERADTWRLLQFPDKGVFTTAAADDKDFHRH